MPRRPLILILITKADIGGAQVHVLEILKRLKQSYHFVLAAGERDYLTMQAENLGVEVRILDHLKRPINLAEDRRSLAECIALLRELKPDLLHTHSSKAGVIGRLAAWYTGTPSLFTAHGWAFTEGVPILRKGYGLVLEFLLARIVGRVLTVSEYDYNLAQHYRVGTDRNRYLVVNGISRPNLKLEPESQPVLQILTVGRLNLTQKNQAMLLDALAAVRVPFHARIIGEGESRRMLETRIIELGLGDKVELLGEVTHTTDYLASADVFVLTSNYEGLPLSVLEAMSLGLPVIATNVGGVQEAVLHEQTGLLSTPKDALAFAANIEKLATDDDLRHKYGRRAKLHYEQRFTADRMIKELELIYRDMLSEN